jgi:hypothetical protein
MDLQLLRLLLVLFVLQALVAGRAREHLSIAEEAGAKPQLQRTTPLLSSSSCKLIGRQRDSAEQMQVQQQQRERPAAARARGR